MNSQNENLKSHEERKYIGMTLDPVHIGTGGYRLGRVDNTIARDPTTNLPVVFGSSLEGTARTYSAYKLIEERKDEKYLNCAGKSDEETGKRVQCGACEICLTYGFSNDLEKVWFSYKNLVDEYIKTIITKAKIATVDFTVNLFIILHHLKT